MDLGDLYFFAHNDSAMNITLSLTHLVSLIAGVTILIVPRLNNIDATYLIVAGLPGLFGNTQLH